MASEAQLCGARGAQLEVGLICELTLAAVSKLCGETSTTQTFNLSNSIRINLAILSTNQLALQLMSFNQTAQPAIRLFNRRGWIPAYGEIRRYYPVESFSLLRTSWCLAQRRE
jgi:hypothetical protein